MSEWEVVYRDEHGYIELSPIFYPKNVIKKRT